MRKKEAHIQGTVCMCDAQTPNWSKAILWLNLVLSIFIVFLHANLESTHTAYTSAKRIINTLADAATPAFFGISAYCAFRNYRVEAYFSVLKKKIVSLLVPFVIWNMVGYFYRVCMVVLGGADDLTFSVRSLFLSEYNTPLWFLRTLFGYVLISPAIYYCTKRKQVGITVILAALALNTFIQPRYSSMLFWLPIYLAGAVCALHYKELVEDTEKEKHKKTGYGLICLVGLVTIAVVFSLRGDSMLYYLYRMMSGATVIASFWLISWHSAPSSILQNSFFTFCFHSLLIGIFKRLYYFVYDGNTAGDVLGYICCAAAFGLQPQVQERF